MPSTGQDARYRVLRRLASGGMAEVSLAEDAVLGRWVALKRLRSTGDPDAIKRLRREALVGASLSHPNLVSVYDVWEEGDGDLVIVMEYVAGDTLRDLIRTRGATAPANALRILTGVGAALDAVHARGIVHRDVKPANILLGLDGQVKLADLGIAAIDDHSKITTSGEVVGTFRYMAPEQLEGAHSTPAMDIYALAAVAFEVLSGQKARPEPNPLALAHAIATQPPPDLRERWTRAPAAAAELLKRAMAADPAARPKTASELVGRLRAALDPETTEADAVAEVAAAAAATERLPAAAPAAPAPAPASAARPAPPARVAPAARPAPVNRVARARPPAAQRIAPAPGRRRPAAFAWAFAAMIVLIGVFVLILSSGGGGSRRAAVTGASRGTRHTASKPAPKHTASTGPGSPTSPASAVQTFYERAAHHDYAGAWALADQNMRNQLNGYSSFQSQMSAVRAITFHQAQPVSGTSGSTATVSVRTTAVLADKTQNCAGTAQTVRSPGGTWLLDHIAINCNPA